jgi:hypothetical protein
MWAKIASLECVTEWPNGPSEAHKQAVPSPGTANGAKIDFFAPF